MDLRHRSYSNPQHVTSDSKTSSSLFGLNNSMNYKLLRAMSTRNCLLAIQLSETKFICFQFRFSYLESFVFAWGFVRVWAADRSTFWKASEVILILSFDLVGWSNAWQNMRWDKQWNEIFNLKVLKRFMRKIECT